MLLVLKSFGDLVIASTALRSLLPPDGDPMGLAIGSHLGGLAADLGLRPDHEVPIADGRVPALFDVRKRGIGAAAASAWRLRRAVAKLPPSRLIVDRLGARERLLVGGRPAAAARGDTGNVYGDYAAMAARLGFGIAEHHGAPTARGGGERSLGLFPASRMAAKNLPLPLVKRVLDEAERAGWSARLMLLEGERPDLEALPAARVLPRGFANMIEAVRSVDLVVSADSLPAHLAEREGRPVFVYSPVPNTYWLPRSAYRAGRWSLFEGAPDGLRVWLAAAGAGATDARSGSLADVG